MNTYNTKFRGAVSAEQADDRDPKQCSAYGCKCRSSVKLSGGWACFAHAFAEPEDWQSVTMLMRENAWLAEFIDEIKAMESKQQDWRGFSMQFWDNDKAGQPHPAEPFANYENRMRSEFLHRIGQVAKRPEPRLPKNINAKPGAFANMRVPMRRAA